MFRSTITFFHPRIFIYFFSFSAGLVIFFISFFPLFWFDQIQCCIDQLMEFVFSLNVDICINESSLILWKYKFTVFYCKYVPHLNIEVLR